MKIAFVVLIGFLLAEFNAVHANDITVISFGRADQAAFTKAYYRPFREATGIDVKVLLVRRADDRARKDGENG